MKSISLKHFLFVLSVMCFAATGSAQTATIKGQVSLGTGVTADNVSVVLKNTQIGTVTDQAGNFEIKNIKPGNYVLRVSLVGFGTKEKNVTVEAGSEIVENFELVSSSEQLEDVTIEGHKVNKFMRKESAVVSKMPLKDIENPQVYNTISAEVLKEQNITNFDDALKNAPGIDKLWESTGRGGDGAGYFSLRGFAVQPTMANGLPSLTNGSPDPANVERIEVVKGPSGTLFGSSLISYGGLINVTTKRPYSTFGGSVSYIGGTYGLNRVTLDVNNPIGSAGKAAARINAAYHSEASFQDAGFKRSVFIAPSFTYNHSDKLSFFVNTEFFNGKSTNQTMLFPDRGSVLRYNSVAELGYDNERSYTSNDLYMETPTFNLQGIMSYKINDKWTSQTAVSRSSSRSEGYYSYLYEGTSTISAQLVAQGQPEITQGSIFARYTSRQNYEKVGLDVQQNFIGEYNIGFVKNKFIGGVEYLNLNTIDNSTGYGAHGFVNIGVDPTYFAAFAPTLNALYSIPMSSTPDDTGVLTQDGADAGIAALAVFPGFPQNPSTNPYRTKQEVFSAYASNIFYFMPNLSVMASLRADRFSNKGDITTTSDDHNQTAFSPKFGVVYQPIQDKVAIFANYMNGFTNVVGVNDVVNGANVGRSFDPEHANQFEFGVKLNGFSDRLTATVSYYDIQVDDRVYLTYVDNGTLFPDQINVQNGKQRNKGFEASITANPIDGLNILAGYSYNDSRLEEGDADFLGRRPESAGPRNLANLWASYRLTAGKLQGLGAGFGLNYGSKNAIMNRNLAGTLYLPEYTVLNASIFYQKSDFTINLKLDNLTDEEYYKGWSTISPQRPRVFSAGVSYNF
ncbi:TonB-dependent receptor [Flavobacterium sp.]|uniref:TonB-dependent receptor n=1 Tax=Flavobacterium sp. TaxID=239 RepID=UPI0025B82B60|nr:TonB-dependent receptor [Flavobacterium sp.]